MSTSLSRTLAFLLVAVTAPALGAQEAKKPASAGDHAAHEQHAQPTKGLDAELAGHFKGIDLTDEQVKRIVEVKAKHHQAMDALKKDAKDPNDAALKAALQKHMDAEHAEFKALLTAEQHKAFEENMKGHHKAEAGDAKHDMKHGAKPDPKKP
jgi:Spy/CpxP family protein refolding chaperone